MALIPPPSTAARRLPPFTNAQIAEAFNVADWWLRQSDTEHPIIVVAQAARRADEIRKHWQDKADDLQRQIDVLEAKVKKLSG